MRADWSRRVANGVVLPIVVLLAACGGGGGSEGECTSNADCAEGEYCGAAGLCTFDCRMNSDCPGGLCSSLGQCVGGRPDAGVPDSRRPDLRRTPDVAPAHDTRPSVDSRPAPDAAQPVLQVTGIQYPALFPGDKFPTALAHLVGLPSLSQPRPLVRLGLKNSGGAGASSVVVEAQLSGYSTVAAKTVSLPAGASEIVELTPAMDVAKLFTLTTEVPSSIAISVKWGASVVEQDTHAVSILGRNALDMGYKDPFSAVFVTPSDKAGSINKLLAAAAQKMPGKQMVGYQGLGAKPFTATIDVGYVASEFVYLLAGHKICGALDQVVGGADADIDLFAMDSANYSLFMAGQTCSVVLKLPDAVSGSTFCFTAPKEDVYYLVYYNTPDNYVSRTVARSRQASHYEVALYQGEAIYNVLKQSGMTYVNTPGGTTWWNSLQNIKYPSETLADKAGNCIDGTLLFASAFEAMGMRPVILYVPSHAFVGVRLWSNEDTVVPIETTMVGSDGFDAAHVEGLKKLDTYHKAGTLKLLDIAATRPLGISPAPM